MSKMLKRKEKEPQSHDVAMVIRQDKIGNPSLHKDIKTCYYCDKIDNTKYFGYEAKNKDKENTFNIKEDDDYASVL